MELCYVGFVLDQICRLIFRGEKSVVAVLHYDHQLEPALLSFVYRILEHGRVDWQISAEL